VIGEQLAIVIEDVHYVCVYIYQRRRQLILSLVRLLHPEEREHLPRGHETGLQTRWITQRLLFLSHVTAFARYGLLGFSIPGRV
jgi:hypothetical protein